MLVAPLLVAPLLAAWVEPQRDIVQLAKQQPNVTKDIINNATDLLLQPHLSNKTEVLMSRVLSGLRWRLLKFLGRTTPCLEDHEEDHLLAVLLALEKLLLHTGGCATMWALTPVILMRIPGCCVPLI